MNLLQTDIAISALFQSNLVQRWQRKNLTIAILIECTRRVTLLILPLFFIVVYHLLVLVARFRTNKLEIRARNLDLSFIVADGRDQAHLIHLVQNHILQLIVDVVVLAQIPAILFRFVHVVGESGGGRCCCCCRRRRRYFLLTVIIVIVDGLLLERRQLLLVVGGLVGRVFMIVVLKNAPLVEIGNGLREIMHMRQIRVELRNGRVRVAC
mmetsp:Transcript_25231/g.41048  ORF Transcript_25231/g.41048 Transcript_25231/m.41048 type:complete len:210 (+) Transcript_25231:2858-3487(+)